MSFVFFIAEAVISESTDALLTRVKKKKLIFFPTSWL